jgi:small subunit ribosomal protein S15
MLSMCSNGRAISSHVFLKCNGASSFSLILAKRNRSTINYYPESNLSVKLPTPIKLSHRPNQQILELEEDTMDASLPKLSRKRVRNITLTTMGISKKAAKERGIASTKFLDQLIESQASCKETFGSLIQVKKDSPSTIYQYNIQSDEIPKDASDIVKRILSIDMASKKEINELIKKQVIQTFASHSKDTGSPEVQIGVLTFKILVLLEHLKKYRKDHPAKSLAIHLIHHRRRALKHLKKKSLPRYFEMLNQLNLTWSDLV